MFLSLVRPSISRENSDVSFTEENKPGTVRCIVSQANPAPIINWFIQPLYNINDEPKAADWKPAPPTSTLSSLSGGKYESSLAVPSNQPKSFYRCDARNNAGFDKRVYKFFRFGKYFS